ncbi:nucleotidyltransferase domain-containing protein [Paenibacillus sp. GCM10023252]|uniref:nucleotidyltransferase domain-containing protein n=1 Tax=Paenibacillus sp. GCM10023252 TaxID=3252649 RepID=UPI0036234517
MKKAIEAATMFVNEELPHSTVALLAGSVVRDQATATSDLDIVVLQPDLQSAYRESVFAYGWPIELFVHNDCSLKEYWASDRSRRIPSLPRMCSEGVVLRDTVGAAAGIQEEASSLLLQGPSPFTEAEDRLERYFITDLLDDLEGSDDYDEQLFIAHELTNKLCNYVLVKHGHWMGKGKWVPRLMKQMDTSLYDELAAALSDLYRLRDKSRYCSFVSGQLERSGGRLFAGFSLGKSLLGE